MSNVNLTEQYRPQSLSEVQGNNKTLKKVKQWAKDWTEGDQPLMFHGKQGTGKTSTAEALANDMGWNTIDVNASDNRTKDAIERMVKSAQSGASIDDTQTLLIIDEIDSFDARTSVKPLKDLFKEAPLPIILIGNEEYKIPDSLKNQCKGFEFKLNKGSLKALIKRVAEAEDIDIGPREIGKLATRDDGRSALNDLQQIATGMDLDWDDRDMDQSPFDAVDNIIEGKPYVGMNIYPPDFVVWLDENLTADLNGLERLVAYDTLARADKWLGRCQGNDWHWMKYGGQLMKTTAECRLTEPYGGYIYKQYPSWFRSKQKHANDATAESALYRKFSGMENNTAGVINCKYRFFRKHILPELKALPKEERYEIILDHDVPKDAVGALGVEWDEYEEWAGSEAEEREYEEESIFDF